MLADPRSLAWRLHRCALLGLVVGPRGTPIEGAHSWTADQTPWARAPRRETWPALDHAVESPWTRMWVLDACTDDLAVTRARHEYAATERGAWHLERALRVLDASRPTWDEIGVTLTSLVGASGLQRATYAPLSIADASSALGWPVERLAAMARRGDVRTVRQGRARLVPVEEIERLILGAP